MYIFWGYAKKLYVKSRPRIWGSLMIRFPQKLIWCSDRSVITITVSGQSLIQSFPNPVAKLNIFSLWALIGNLRFYQVLLEYRKSSIKPPPPHTFQRRKVNKPLLSIKPPPPPPPPSTLSSILIFTNWTDQLQFIQVGNSYFFWSSAAWPPTSYA